MPVLLQATSATSNDARWVDSGDVAGGRTYSGDSPGDLYVDVATGDDANDGLTPATAVATLTRAIQLIPISPTYGDATTVHVAAGDYPMPGRFGELTNVAFEGTLGAADTRTIAGVVAASDALGLIVTIDGAVPGDDDLLGKLVTYNDGAAAGLQGTVYRNVGATVYITQDSATTFVAPGPGDSLSFYDRTTKFVSTDTTPFLIDCIEVSLTNIEFGREAGNSVRQWFVASTDKIAFNGCQFHEMNLRMADGGAAYFINCYYATTNTTMLDIARNSSMVWQRGTVFDGVNAGADPHLREQPGASITTLGEVVFRRLGASGIEIEGIGINLERDASTHQVWRFDDCAAGLRFNVSRGSGGGSRLPNLYGVGPTPGVAGAYVVTGQLNAFIMLGTSSNCPTSGVANAVSADNGTSNIAYNATDGTLILNGSPTATQIGVVTSGDRSIPISPGNTVEDLWFPPVNVTVIGVYLYAVTAPASAAGTYTFTLTDESNGSASLLSATFNLETLVSGTRTSVALTGTAANLRLTAGNTIRASFISDNVDLTGAGLYWSVLAVPR